EESAIDHYVQAIDAGDRRPQVLFRVTQLLFSHARYREAQQVLRKLETLQPLQGVQLRLAAELAVRTNDFPRALEAAGRAVVVHSGDYRDHLWLARIQEATGRLADARASLEKA